MLRETVKTEDTNKYLFKIFLIKNISSFDGPCESGCSYACEDGHVGSDVSCEKFSLPGLGRGLGRGRGGGDDGGDQV